MPIYDGVVMVADDDIPVILELDDDMIRMSASGTEIGTWRTDECEITHVAASTYTIKAEDEVLSFVPSEPRLFAAAINGSATREIALPPTPRPEPADAVREASAPKPLTMGLFYALCAVTAALAVWSLVSIVL